MRLQVEPRSKGGHLEGSPAAVYEYRKRGETLDVFRNAYKGTFLAAGGAPAAPASDRGAGPGS